MEVLGLLLLLLKVMMRLRMRVCLKVWVRVLMDMLLLLHMDILRCHHLVDLVTGPHGRRRDRIVLLRLLLVHSK